ncbi:hypothetical protein [Minwuia thermotolerans]|uniref:Uncharacterized protein n=1 Tax=Minwuia thermotolerans TaxID=2056226 RepID=A0A2M9G281_9PROT|nr:hypothetical protein [Minwuia thermotolerans]PJK29829.1 hypothetical protein CVT23_08610 [Minwuia thermotolerans]
MELIRSDEVVAINEVIVEARDGVARLRAAADGLDTDRARRVLAEADRIDALAENLADVVRSKDDFPHAPHDETVMIEQAIARLQALFVDDGEEVLKEVAGRVDENLRDTVARVRHQVGDTAALKAMDDLRIRI